MSEDMFPQIALLTEAVLEFSPRIQRLNIRLLTDKHCYQSVLGTQNYLVVGDGGSSKC